MDAVSEQSVLTIRGFDSAPQEMSPNHMRCPTQRRPSLSIPSFDLFAGKCHAIIGKSGAGKTVLNSFLLGFPSFRLGGKMALNQMKWWSGVGAVDIDRRDFLSQSRLSRKWAKVRHSGTLLYLPQILPDGRGYQMSVRKYLEQVLPALYSQAHCPNVSSDAAFASFPLELSHILGNRVTSLSGGERRRIELWARLSVLKRLPKNRQALLILDEPTTGLDVPDERRYLSELREEMKSLGNLAVLITTHALYFLDDTLPDDKQTPLFDYVFLVHKKKNKTNAHAEDISCRVTAAADSRHLCEIVKARNPNKSVEDNMEDFVEWQAGLSDSEFSMCVENVFRERRTP